MSRLSETFRVGTLEVAALSDGAPDRALGGFFTGAETGEWTAALGITDPEQPMPFNFGTFLVREGDSVTLIDSGFGTPGREMGVPGGGELLDRLGELGVSRRDVRTIVHTHLHPDHCGWDIDGDNDRAVTFPNARVFVAQAEVDYWMAAEQAEDQRSRTARLVVPALRDASRLETFEGEHAVSAGLTMVPTPGHTPGHCSVLLNSQGEHLLVLGDAAHHPIHLEHHGWLPAVDIDPAESQRSRAKLAALAVEKDAVVTGGHWPILTLARVRRSETGYVCEVLDR